jgi:hypothetical protein
VDLKLVVVMVVFVVVRRSVGGGVLVAVFGPVKEAASFVPLGKLCGYGTVVLFIHLLLVIFFFILFFVFLCLLVFGFGGGW